MAACGAAVVCVVMSSSDVWFKLRVGVPWAGMSPRRVPGFQPTQGLSGEAGQSTGNGKLLAGTVSRHGKVCMKSTDNTNKRKSVIQQTSSQSGQPLQAQQSAAQSVP